MCLLTMPIKVACYVTSDLSSELVMSYKIYTSNILAEYGNSIFASMI